MQASIHSVFISSHLPRAHIINTRVKVVIVAYFHV